MLLTEVELPDGPLVFAADLVPGLPWVHLPVTMGYDRYPEVLIEEKARLFKDLLARKGRLFFTHDSTTAMGRLHIDEQGRYGCVEPCSDLIGLSH
jgi:glyoxylase-like metal-dependent hydrolase (beta-lactamase superfamily II)